MSPTDGPRKFVYMDPPYFGQAQKHYGDEAAADGRVAREVNHEVLIGTACEQYDGWALSLSSPSLRTILPLCPEDARVMVWLKPFHVFKRNVNPSYGWEPVIVWHPRPRPADGPAYMHGYRDWVEAGVIAESITLQTGVVGAKPERFCFWLFEVLNLQPGDEFIDMFPGSGSVAAAFERWQRIGPWNTGAIEQGALL